ncbi:uncharacterized protein LOC110728268 [Chenopodium quinoa]|uniref:uncharacterized protein LOC110728268 n=1 Tax=Chenopodium quinoa TaxID=63459 RepID=UPI000B76F0CD|nr:uncharacterized protein LOC110728268 [Chenopodium quinoa]
MPQRIPNPENKFCKLIKSLYGLKQAFRQWFSKLHNELIQQGYSQSKNDYYLYLKRSAGYLIVVAVYMDDIIITGDDTDEILRLKKHLDDTFSIKDLRMLSYFLGIKVKHRQDGIASTPLPINLNLVENYGNFCPNPALYRSLVGKLNFLTHTRLDLSYVIQTLSQFMHQPRQPHMDALHHVLGYIAGFIGQGILLQGSDSLTLRAYSDSDKCFICPLIRAF